MKRKLHAFIFVLAMGAGMFGFISSRSVTKTYAASSAVDLLNELPASDVIAYINTQRILNDMIPVALSNNPTVLAKIKKELDEIRQELGVDPYSIESAVIGISSSKKGSESVVAIVRGRFDAKELIEIGLAKAEKERKVKRQEITYEGRTIYLIKGTKSKNKSKTPHLESFKNETAMLMLDSSTVVIGDSKGAKATIDAALGRNKVSDELIALATRQSSALIGFSGDMKAFGTNPFGVKEAESFLNGIAQFYGAVWTTGNDIEGQLTIRTDTTERARQLGEALNGLKLLLSSGFGSKSDDKNVVKDFLRGININSTGNEVDIHGKTPMNNLNSIEKSF